MVAPENPLSQKRLLLLGGGHAEIPLIKAAKSLGYYVITTGNDCKGLGHAYADKNVFEDFSDKDKMLSLAKAERVDAVCSGCNDFALLSTAFVCEKLGLPGHDSLETSLQLHIKDKFRNLAGTLGIPAPKSIVVKCGQDVESALAEMMFPLVVKPVDLTGGKGVRRVENLAEACDAVNEAFLRTRENRVVIEEFVTGSNHGYSCLLKKRKVSFEFCDNELYFLNKYMVAGAYTPSSSSQGTLNKLREYCERIAERLLLVDGILHVQYIERADGEPVIIEICRRPPGDLYVSLVQKATGLDYSCALVLAETGRMDEFKTSRVLSQNRPMLRHCVMAESCGAVQDVIFAPEILGNVVDKMMWFSPGDRIDDYLHYKAGIVFVEFENFDEMNSKLPRINELIRVIVLQE